MSYAHNVVCTFYSPLLVGNKAPSELFSSKVSVEPLEGPLELFYFSNSISAKSSPKIERAQQRLFFHWQLSAGISSTSWDRITVCFVFLLAFLLTGYHSQRSTHVAVIMCVKAQ